MVTKDCSWLHLPGMGNISKLRRGWRDQWIRQHVREAPVTFTGSMTPDTRPVADRIASMDVVFLCHCRAELGLSDAEIIRFDLDKFTWFSEVEMQLHAEPLSSPAERLAAFDEANAVYAEYRQGRRSYDEYLASFRLASNRERARYAQELESAFTDNRLEDFSRPRQANDTKTDIGPSRINPLVLPEPQPRMRERPELPVDAEVFLRHPRFIAWLKTFVGSKAKAGTDPSVLISIAGLSHSDLLREYLVTLNMLRLGDAGVSALYPAIDLDQVETATEALRVWSTRLSDEAARLRSLCERAEQMERGAETRRRVFFQFGAAYNAPDISAMRYELSVIADNLASAADDDMLYANSVLTAKQGREAAEQSLHQLNVRLTPPVGPSIALKRYRIRVVGDYSMDVRVVGETVDGAKDNLRAETVESGTTPQEKHRRYERGEGGGWCDNGIATFWAGLQAVQLDKPFYSYGDDATLIIRELPYEAGPQQKYRFFVTLSDESSATTYGAVVSGRSFYEALDRLLDGGIELVIEAGTPYADEDDATIDFTYGEQPLLALFAMLTPDQTDFSSDDMSVCWEPVE